MRSLSGTLLLSMLFLVVFSSVVSAEELTVLSFNVESGNAKPSKICDEDLARIPGVEVFGFSEVRNATEAATFETFLDDGNPAAFERLLGTTGDSDRLMIIFDTARLELIEHGELMDLRASTGRAPLWAKFRTVEDDVTFIFMVNHLHRSNASKRLQQAEGLNEWASAQTLPVIAVGDYNIDWDIPSSGASRDAGFDALLAGDHFTWERPASLVTTQCNPYFNSVLDFVFTSNEAQDWVCESTILFPEASYCSRNAADFSDHRPVIAQFEVGIGPRPEKKCDTTAIRQLIEELKAKVAELEAAVAALE